MGFFILAVILLFVYSLGKSAKICDDATVEALLKQLNHESDEDSQ